MRVYAQGLISQVPLLTQLRQFPIAIECGFTRDRDSRWHLIWARIPQRTPWSIWKYSQSLDISRLLGFCRRVVCLFVCLFAGRAHLALLNDYSWLSIQKLLLMVLEKLNGCWGLKPSQPCARQALLLKAVEGIFLFGEILSLMNLAHMISRHS